MGWGYYTLFFPEFFFQLKNNPELLGWFILDFFSGNY